MAKRKAVRGSGRKPAAKGRSSNRRRAAAKKTAVSRKIARKATKKAARKATAKARVKSKAAVRRAKPAARPRVVARKKTAKARKSTPVKAKAKVKAKVTKAKARPSAAARPSSAAPPSRRAAPKVERPVGADSAWPEPRTEDDLRRRTRAVATVLARSGSHRVGRPIGAPRDAREVRGAHRDKSGADRLVMSTRIGSLPTASAMKPRAETIPHPIRTSSTTSAKPWACSIRTTRSSRARRSSSSATSTAGNSIRPRRMIGKIGRLNSARLRLSKLSSSRSVRAEWRS